MVYHMSKIPDLSATFYVSNVELNQSYITWYEDIKSALSNNLPEPKMPHKIVDAMMRISHRLSYNYKFIGYTFKEDLISDALYDCVRFAKGFNPYKMLHKAIFECVSGSLEVKDVITGETSGLVGIVKFYNSKTLGSSLQMSSDIDFTVGEFVISQTGARYKVIEITSHFANNPFSYLTTTAFNAFLRRIDKEKKETYIKKLIISSSPMSEFLENNIDDVEYTNMYIQFLQESETNDSIPMSVKRSKKFIQENEIKVIQKIVGPLSEFENE